MIEHEGVDPTEIPNMRCFYCGTPDDIEFYAIEGCYMCPDCFAAFQDAYEESRALDPWGDYE